MKIILYISIFIVFIIGIYSNKHDKTSSCNIKTQDPNAITLISTIDGTMVAVNTFTGNEIWRYKDKPLLETPKTLNKNFLFLPNPQDGNLFVYTDNKLKRLPFTIPQLVQTSPCKTNDGIFYAGSKKDVWLSVHFERGLQSEEIRNSLDENICPVSKDKLVYIGRSEYQLIMKNSTNNDIWNVTYYDYTSYIPNEDDDKSSLIYLSKPGSGKIICLDTESKTIMWEKNFSSVIIDTFYLKKDGLHYAVNRFVGSETLDAFIEVSFKKYFYYFKNSHSY
uniref:Bulb-type lectin domain-containing protein n=1 Tax=Strongyloides stercoralis TaxID=6248 RepID=A0A0K0EM91_STRER